MPRPPQPTTTPTWTTTSITRRDTNLRSTSRTWRCTAPSNRRRCYRRCDIPTTSSWRPFHTRRHQMPPPRPHKRRAPDSDERQLDSASATFSRGHRARECPRKVKAAGVTRMSSGEPDVHRHRCLRYALLTATSLSVFAANGTQVSIHGCLRLAFTVQGITLFVGIWGCWSGYVRNEPAQTNKCHKYLDRISCG